MAHEIGDFQHSNIAEPHRGRTKEILKKHPEIRTLIGPDSSTIWYALGLVSIQFVLAYAVKDASWWVVFAVAYCLGAFANHALFVVVHECAHRLVFRPKFPNFLAGVWSNLPLFFPSAVSFQKYHLKHHAFQGVYELDADVPSVWEAKVIGHSAFGKAIWLLLYPFFQLTRPWRLREIAVLDRWTMANFVIQVSFNVAVYMVLGPKSFWYFFLSLFFSIGLHPLGARWIQRHYTTGEGDHGDQETFSYYGPLNKIAFNVGYHNEHHDFPSVPWTRLPQIRAIAPEYYNNLEYHMSWTRLLFKFLFDRELSLFSRVVRTERNRVQLDDEVKPDVELVRAGT